MKKSKTTAKKVSKAASTKKVEKPAKKSAPKKSEHKKVETKKETSFKFDIGIAKKLIPIFFIFLVMFMAFFLRSGPITLDGLDDRVEENTLNQIRGVIEQQLSAQYTNLRPEYLEQEVQKEYDKVIKQGYLEIGTQKIVIDEVVAQNQESIKQAFKADDGQTYLNAIDPYYFLHLSKNLYEKGHTGDILENDTPLISTMLAPVGVQGSYDPDFHTWLEAKLYGLNGLEKGDELSKYISAIFLLPVFLAMLSGLVAFILIRKFTNDLFALFGSLILVSISTFVSRTVAGFVDTDGYNLLFPLLITAALIYSFTTKNKLYTVLFGILAGFFQAMFLWAWGPGWFIFVFLAVALIGYLVYLLGLEAFKLASKEKMSFDIVNDVLALVSFVLSSYLLTYLIRGSDLFVTAYKGIFGSISGIATISKDNIWPNVLSSVAELNPATFNSILASVGGKFIFFLALFGILALILDYTSKKKFVLIKRAIFGLGTLWFAIIVFGGAFVSMTANLKLFFLILMFLPIGFALALSFYEKNSSSKVFFAMLLSVWVAGTIYMSLNGTRFILLLIPAFAVSLSFGFYYLASMLNKFLAQELKLKTAFTKAIPGFVLMGILFLVIYVPMFNQANAISQGTLPNFGDAWYETLEKVGDNSNESAIITSWWDFGHFFIVGSNNRGVTFDGASQTTPRAHWVGRLFMENDEQVSLDILRMLVCGGNEAFNSFYAYVGKDSSDSVKINKIIYETFGKNRAETRDILANNKYYELTDNQIDDILEKLECQNPPENFVITSEDMVGKAGVWAHWGSWDFTRKYVFDNYKSMSADEIAQKLDEETQLIQTYINELNAIDERAVVENIKREDLMNQWLAPYPSYIPIQNRYEYACQEGQNATLVCQNGIIVDFTQGKVSAPAYNGQLTFSNLIYMSVNQELVKVPQEEQGDIDVLIMPSQTGFNVRLMQAPLGASLFTKLFYLNGFGTEHFELFDNVDSMTGINVKTWKVNFQEVSQEIEKTSVPKIGESQTIELNMSSEEVQETLNISLNSSSNSNNS